MRMHHGTHTLQPKASTSLSKSVSSGASTSVKPVVKPPNGTVGGPLVPAPGSRLRCHPYWKERRIEEEAVHVYTPTSWDSVRPYLMAGWPGVAKDSRQKPVLREAVLAAERHHCAHMTMSIIHVHIGGAWTGFSLFRNDQQGDYRNRIVPCRAPRRA